MPEDAYEKAVRTFRRESVEAEFRQSQNFDKAVLTLSSGALGLSLVFIKDLAPQPTSTSSLLVAWVLFGGAVASILVAMMCSQRSYRRERDLLDMDESGQSTTSETNRWVRATGVFNTMAGVAFLVGVVFLICFVHTNLPEGEKAMLDQLEPGDQSEPFDGQASQGSPHRPMRPILPATPPEEVDEISPNDPQEEPTKTDPEQEQDES